MTSQRWLLVFFLLSIIVFLPNRTASGFPASSFYLQDGDWYDNWEINRNYYAGFHGYLPNLAFESLNENKDVAYSIGQSFQDQYYSEVERAVAILKYVQTWTDYGYDSDNVIRSGVAQEEWAWNADEMTNAFNQTTGVKAVGDCEDLAFLCGTIYVGAGFDAAIVDAPEHVALLIWLPDFSNADIYWDLPNDNRDAGWIWVEATGGSNPLGWTPPDFEDGGWTAYSIGNLEFDAEPQPSESTSTLIRIDELVLLIAVVSIILVLTKIMGKGLTTNRWKRLP
jgi:hypothetical protein